MNVVKKFLIGAYSQCYDCSIGRICSVGNVVKDNGFVFEVIFLCLCYSIIDGYDKDACETYEKIIADLNKCVLQCK